MAETQSNTPQGPTGDIKIFIDTFNTEFDKKTKELSKNQENLKNIYNDAISISKPRTSTWPKDENVKTIGDLFKYTFPDITTSTFVKPPEYVISTGYSNYIDNAKMSDYISWEKDFNTTPDIKEKFDKIKKGLNGNNRLEGYNSVKKPGITNPSLYSPGQYYFDVFMKQVLSPSGPFFNETSMLYNSFTNAGLTPSISYFEPNGDLVPDKKTAIEQKKPILDYSSFDEYVLSSVSIEIESLTTINIDSYSELKVMYRSGLLEDLKKDPTFDITRGDEVTASNQSYFNKPIGEFVGNNEQILLYKAFVQAGDNYKSVVLPLRNPETPKPQTSEVVSPVTPTEVKPDTQELTFNVEKKDTFILVGGTVSPPLELTIVPNDGTSYIFTPDPNVDTYNNLEDLDEEYKESDFEALEEVEIKIEPQKALERIDSEEMKQYQTPPGTGGGGGGGASGTSNYVKPSGTSASDWKKNGLVVNGAKVPANLSGPAKYNAPVKINNTMQKEYIPVIKSISGYTNGAKLLAIVMAQQEGFAPNTRSYKTNNPGNIGNTDSGSNKALKTLADGIKLQLEYLTKVAKGANSNYPVGKNLKISPYFSPEIEKNNGDGVGDGPKAPYKGMTAYVPGYNFTPYTGKIEEFVKIYATGARTGNSYVTMIVSWFRQNGYSWVTEETTLKQLVEQDSPASALA